MSQLTEQISIAPPKQGRTLLQASGIRKSFKMGGSDIVVLKNANLDVRAGEFIAIEGRSGSGKSTLLHILAALDSVDAGSISFEGVDYTRRPLPPPSLPIQLINGGIGQWALRILSIGTLSLWITDGMVIVDPTIYHKWLIIASWMSIAALSFWLLRHALRFVRFLSGFKGERPAAQLRNAQFGFVFQFYHLLPELNVLENAMIGPKISYSWFSFQRRASEIRGRAIQLLEQLGMSHRLKHRPNQLSGGERQRVAIARALMNSPKILFADEPTGNLDADTGRQIMTVLEKLHRDHGQTIVMVTHDRSLARQADRVLVLKDGKLEAVSKATV